LTLVKITTRVRTPGGFASLPVGASSLTSLTWGEEESLEHMGPRRKLRSRPEPTSDQTSLVRIHYSSGAALLPGTPTISTRISYQYKDPSRSHPRLRHKNPPKLATPVLLAVG